MVSTNPESPAQPEADPSGHTSEGSPGTVSGESFARVLAEDLVALASDALNYVDAELAFQKTRARLAGNRLVTAIALGIVGAVLVLLAAIGLTIGLLIALIPLVTAWGATAIVVSILLVLAWLAARGASDALASIKRAFASDALAEDDTHG